jgi:hypothetical protein
LLFSFLFFLLFFTHFAKNFDTKWRVYFFHSVEVCCKMHLKLDESISGRIFSSLQFFASLSLSTFLLQYFEDDVASSFPVSFLHFDFSGCLSFSLLDLFSLFFVKMKFHIIRLHFFEF